MIYTNEATRELWLSLTMALEAQEWDEGSEAHVSSEIAQSHTMICRGIRLCLNSMPSPLLHAVIPSPLI